jgi:tetratricopeptide (TPR) repeat protein
MILPDKMAPLIFEKPVRFARILLLIISLVGTDVFAQEVPDWLKLSFDYLEQNRLDSAEFALKNVLRLKPDGQLNPFLLNNLGTVQRRMGKKKEALMSYTAALGQYPKNPVFLEDRASLLAEMGQAGDAITDYTALLEQKPNDEEALYQRGLLYLQLRNTDLAEKDFNRMLELNPNGLYPRMGIASLAKIRGDYDDAEKIYNYLIDKEPEMPSLFAGRAELYLLTERPGKASSDATRALRLYGENDNQPYLYIVRCRAKILLREKKSALEDLEKAISLGYDPKEAEEIRKLLR